MKTVRFSKTGVARGSGSDRFRYVAFMSKEDKSAVARGETVVVERSAGQKEKYGFWYVVTHCLGRFGHRLPTDDERKAIEAAQ